MSNITLSSSQYNLNVEANRVSVYILPIIILLGLSTNTMNILVLCRPSLRLSSCSYYFLALSIDSFLYIFFVPINMFLESCFGLYLYSIPIGCRVQLFFIYSWALFFNTMLVCASIDRFISSSSLVWLRQFSNVRIAQKIILIISILTIIYMSPFIIYSYWDTKINRCLQYSIITVNIYLISRVISYYILGPLFMIIFGLLTINNIRNNANRISVVHQNVHRRTEGQLTRVLIIQVLIHLLFSIPNGITYILSTFVPSISISFINGLRIISIIWQQATFILPFFSYILSASVFRKELQKMFKCYKNNNRIMHQCNSLQMQTLSTKTNNIKT